MGEPTGRERDQGDEVVEEEEKVGEMEEKEEGSKERKRARKRDPRYAASRSYPLRLPLSRLLPSSPCRSSLPRPLAFSCARANANLTRYVFTCIS